MQATRIVKNDDKKLMLTVTKLTIKNKKLQQGISEKTQRTVDKISYAEVAKDNLFIVQRKMKPKILTDTMIKIKLEQNI